MEILLFLFFLIAVTLVSFIDISCTQVIEVFKAVGRKVTDNFMLFVLLMGGAASVSAGDVLLSPSDTSLFIDLISMVIYHSGQLSWYEWLGLAHLVALLYVNITPTPADNTAYGKLYSWLLEPLGIGTSKAKQLPKPGIK
jgi:hypothetical protein